MENETMKHSSIGEEYVANILAQEEDLEHHGIKGQRWGRRRWQEEDGSLTAAGRERYGVGEDDDDSSERELPRVLGGRTRVDANNERDRMERFDKIGERMNNTFDKAVEKQNRDMRKELRDSEKEVRAAEKEVERAQKALEKFDAKQEREAQRVMDLADKQQYKDGLRIAREMMAEQKKQEKLDRAIEKEIDSALKERQRTMEEIQKEAKRKEEKEEREKEKRARELEKQKKETEKKEEEERKKAEAKKKADEEAAKKKEEEDRKKAEAKKKAEEDAAKKKEEEDRKKAEAQKKADEEAAKKAEERAKLESEAEKLRGEKQIVDAARGLTVSGKSLSNAIYNKKVRNVDRLDMRQLSNEEMRERIQRYNLEQQYDNMFNNKRKEVESGRDRVNGILETAGAALAVASSVIGIMSAIKSFKAKNS